MAWSTLIGSAIGGDGKDLEIAKVTQDDIALILYTSGTTGKPKGALLSHGNLISNCVQGEAWLTNMDATDQRFLAALPLFHAYGMTTLCVLSIYFGAELILVPSPQMPLIMDIVKKHTPPGYRACPRYTRRSWTPPRKGTWISPASATPSPAPLPCRLT